MLVKETSERSKNYNIAEKKIKSFSNFFQVDFEGISTKKGMITFLMDRALLINDVFDNIINGDYLSEIKKLEPYYEVKKQIARKLNVPWFFVVYSYSESKCFVINLSDDVCNLIVYNSFELFGNWMKNYADEVSWFSSYQESGLPLFDQMLRKNLTPWPGNVDGMLFYDSSKELLFIIEYQNSNKISVRNHDNNDFLSPHFSRKSDKKRWVSHMCLSLALNKSVLVVVWSNNESIIGLKTIKSFETDSLGYVSRIVWEHKVYVEINDLTEKTILDLLNS